MHSKTNVVKYYEWSTLLDEVHYLNAKLILEKNIVTVITANDFFLCTSFIFHLPKTAKIPFICMFNFFANGNVNLAKTN